MFVLLHKFTENFADECFIIVYLSVNKFNLTD